MPLRNKFSVALEFRERRRYYLVNKRMTLYVAKPIDNRRDILLLLLYSPGTGDGFNEPIVGRTRLVKMLFLFKEEVLPHFRRGTSIDENNFYQFFPWNYGPFSREVYDDLTFFILRGFVKSEEAIGEAPEESAREWNFWTDQNEAAGSEIIEYQEESFSLTAKGMRVCDEMYSTLTDGQQTTLRTFKRKMVSLRLEAILKYVYTKYEEQTENSKIKGRILG